MWERAFLFERSTIITVTTEHAYQMSIDNISICMFEEPCNPHSLKLKDAGKTYAAALKAAQVQDNMVNATSASSSASLASSEGSVPPKPLSRAFVQALEDSMKHYAVLPSGTSRKIGPTFS